LRNALRGLFRGGFLITFAPLHSLRRR
jgi:hypothetical protein